MYKCLRFPLPQSWSQCLSTGMFLLHPNHSDTLLWGGILRPEESADGLEKVSEITGAPQQQLSADTISSGFSVTAAQILISPPLLLLPFARLTPPRKTKRKGSMETPHYTPGGRINSKAAANREGGEHLTHVRVCLNVWVSKTCT